MMRIERMQEQLQLPQQLNNESKEFFGVRRIESFVAQPQNNQQFSAPLSSLCVLAAAARGRQAVPLASAQPASSD